LTYNNWVKAAAVEAIIAGEAVGNERFWTVAHLPFGNRAHAGGEKGRYAADSSTHRQVRGPKKTPGKRGDKRMGDHDLRGGQATPFSDAPLGQWDSLFSVLELFPVPMEVFSPEGLSLFVNKEFLNFFHINSAGDIVGKLNILDDPYIHQQLGLTDYVRRAFSGEILSFYDIRVPYEEIISRYKDGKSNVVENDMYQDITCFPLRGETGAVACVVALFMMKRVYQSRLDIMKARAYIEAHWLDDFDQYGIAGAAGLSPDHLTRLFKKMTGQTPYSYYQERKLEKIQEALRDTKRSVREAFAMCGADYNGCFAETFKRKVGMTPTQYRKTLPPHPREDPEYTAGAREQAARPGGPSMHPPIPVCETEDQLFQMAGLFPIPLQIFKQNGDILFINQAVLKAWNVLDSSRILGKYNLMQDPLVNEQYGLREYINRVFQGEVVLIEDIRIPLESFWAWYDTRSADYDVAAIYTNILNFTVWVEDVKEAYVVSVFLTSRLYQGISDVTKAKEYLENHWREDFDVQKLAGAIHLSPSHLARLFKKHTGMTLYDYYQEIKINRLKAALRDQNLSVAQAFVSCGFEYSSNFTRFFKEKVGMTPSQYRKTIKK